MTSNKSIHEVYIEKDHPRWNILESKINDITDLIHVPPTIELNINPNVSVKEIGETINSITLTATTTKKLKDITKIQISRNGTIIRENSNPNVNGSVEIYTDNTIINSTVTYSAEVFDEKSQKEDSKTINFVYPFYIGNVSSITPPANIVKSLTKLLKIKSNTTQKFTLDNSRFCIAYPKSYGDLTSILDQNNFETINLYNKTTVPIVGLNNVSVDYYVYTFKNLTTQTNFSNTYKF